MEIWYYGPKKGANGPELHIAAKRPRVEYNPDHNSITVSNRLFEMELSAQDVQKIILKAAE